MISLTIPAGDLSVLCLGAHPDDIEIGCGGALLALTGRPGVTAHHVILTGERHRQAEAQAATQAFWGITSRAEMTAFDLPDGRLPAHWGEVKEILDHLASEVHPDLVFAPSVDDSHQDHRLLGKLVATAWRDSQVLHYEIPKWDGDLGPVSHYFPLTEAQAHRKVQLLHSCYTSQHGRDWWDDETFFGLMRLRGAECRTRYAEGFRSPKTLVSTS